MRQGVRSRIASSIHFNASAVETRSTGQPRIVTRSLMCGQLRQCTLHPGLAPAHVRDTNAVKAMQLVMKVALPILHVVDRPLRNLARIREVAELDESENGLRRAVSVDRPLAIREIVR